TALEDEDGFSVITHVDGATKVVDDHGGRIRASWAVNGSVRMYDGLYDTQLDVKCQPFRDEMGTWRCVMATQPALQSAYLAPNCSGSLTTYATQPGLSPVI